MKKTLLVLLLAGLSSAGIAHATAIPYVGLGLGADSLHNQETTTSPVATLGGSRDYGNFHPMGKFFAGVDFDLNQKFDLALQPFFDYAHNTATDSNSYNPAYKLTYRYSFGLQALPGYHVTQDVSTHAILGYARGYFQHQFGSSVSFTSNGYQLGLGANVGVAKNVVVSGDAVYSRYQSNTLTDGNATFQTRPSTIDTVLSVIYRYG